MRTPIGNLSAVTQSNQQPPTEHHEKTPTRRTILRPDMRSRPAAALRPERHVYLHRRAIWPSESELNLHDRGQPRLCFRRRRWMCRGSRYGWRSGVRRADSRSSFPVGTTPAACSPRGQLFFRRCWTQSTEILTAPTVNTDLGGLAADPTANRHIFHRQPYVLCRRKCSPGYLHHRQYDEQRPDGRRQDIGYRRPKWQYVQHGRLELRHHGNTRARFLRANGRRGGRCRVGRLRPPYSARLTFRSDMNADGFVNNGDTLIVRVRSENLSAVT